MRKLILSKFTACVVLALAVLVGFSRGPISGVAFAAASGVALSSVAGAFSYRMGMRNQVLLPNFIGTFVASGKCALDVPLGRVYNDITLNFTEGGTAMTVAQMKARITSIVMKLNGKPVREWSPTSLDIANATNGSQWAAANGYLRDFFACPWYRTWEGEERNGLGTDGLKTFTYEIVWSAAAVAPGVTAWSNVEEYNRPVTAYPFRHIRNYNSLAVISGTSQFAGSSLLKAPGLWYSRLHFQSSLITSARLLVNGVTKWENLPLALATELMRNSNLVMQTNVYTLAFDLTSRQFTDILASFVVTGGNAYPVADLRLEYTGSGAGTVDVMAEQFQIVSLI